MPKEAYVGVGSNLEPRRHFIRQSIEHMLMSSTISVLSISSLYESAPYGKFFQGAFLNLAVKILTPLPPKDLLQELQSQEKKLGRKKRVHWGPREIDLDLLFYENHILDDPQIKIPHPEIQKRSFVLHPLAEIAPDLSHPVLKKTIRTLLSENAFIPAIKKIGPLF